MISVYGLPHLLAGEYLLTAVHSEMEQEVQYIATQKDTQREVLVRSLSVAAAQDLAVCNDFIESARACARVQLPFVSAVIELLPVDGSWHIVMEGNGKNSLNLLAVSGQKIRSIDMVSLLRCLCELCLYLDAEGINSRPFRLADVYRNGKEFLLDNPACAGCRTAKVSNRYMIDAAKALLPLLHGGASQGASIGAVKALLTRVAEMPDDCVLVAAEVLRELVALSSLVSVEDIII